MSNLFPTYNNHTTDEVEETTTPVTEDTQEPTVKEVKEDEFASSFRIEEDYEPMVDALLESTREYLLANISTTRTRKAVPVAKRHRRDIRVRSAKTDVNNSELAAEAIQSLILDGGDIPVGSPAVKKGRTEKLTLHIPNYVWLLAKFAAESRGGDIGDVVAAAIDGYLPRHI